MNAPMYHFQAQNWRSESYFVCGHHVNQKHSWLWCFATLFVQRCWLLLGARLKSLVGSQLHCWAILLISGWTVASVWPSFLGKGAGINALSVDLERSTTCVRAIFDKEEATCEAEEGTYLLSTLCFGMLLFLFSNLISDFRTTKQCFRQKKRCWSRGNAFCSIPDSLTCAHDSVAGGEAGTVTSNSMFAAMLVVLPPDLCGVNIRYVLFIVCEPSAPSRSISRHHIMGWGKASAATHYQRPRRIWSRKVVLSTHQRKASNDKIPEWVDSTKSFW